MFAAGAAFEGALLAPDPQPRDRVRTLGWASMVSAMAVVVTVALNQTAVWVAAALLVLLIFSSYALRSWSPRVASLALMGAITVYIIGAGYITIGRIGWFVLALVVGFGWFALWETLILPDNPLRSLNLSVQAFSRRAADTVSGIVDALNTARDGTPSERAGKALRRQPRPGEEVSQRHRNAVPRRRRARLQSKRCRPAARGAALGPKGLEDMADQAEVPDWMRSLPEEIVWSISSTLHALAAALRDDVDEESRDAVARRARVLRGHINQALTQTTKTGEAPFPPEVLLAALTLLGGGEIVAQSVTQARKLAAAAPKVVGAAQPKSDSAATQADTSSPPDSQTLSPTMALAIQAVVAAVAAGLIAKAVGNEQSLVVVWTAFVVIAGSVARWAMFFTIESPSPVSYPAMRVRGMPDASRTRITSNARSGCRSSSY